MRYQPTAPDKPRHVGLCKPRIDQHPLWGKPWYSTRTGTLIMVVLYALIGIPYMLNIIDKLIATYWG